MKKLSIIVPVYNVERYIRPCMESIFRQGLAEDDFEVIVVNDGTKDNSMGVIADILAQHANISVIQQENLSLSVARNNGLTKAQGEYILMPDSDDLLIDNSLPLLLEKALETKADLVVADFLEMYDEEIDKFQGVSDNDTLFTEKTGKALFLEDLNPYQCYVWRTLFRRAFLVDEQLTFVPRLRYQDVPFTHECYLKASRCLRTHRLLNIYRRGRQGAATAAFSKQKAMEFCIVIAKTWELTHMEGLSDAELRKLKEDVYASFSTMMYSVLHAMKDWSEQLQVVRYLNEQAPDLRFSNSTHQRVESFFFSKAPRCYLALRRLHWLWIRRSHRTDK